jgi:hypothetical protein
MALDYLLCLVQSLCHLSVIFINSLERGPISLGRNGARLVMFDSVALSKSHISHWQQYGPVIQVKAFSRPMLILNSHRVSTDLFNDRGKIYSNRPALPFAGELVGWDRSPSFMDLNANMLRDMRKLVQSTISGRSLNQVSIAMLLLVLTFL